MTEETKTTSPTPEIEEDKVVTDFEKYIQEYENENTIADDIEEIELDW